MLKVGRKRKRIERKKDKKHTNSTARIRARDSQPAVSFACLKRHHAIKKTIQDTFDLWILRYEQSRDPPSEKETLLTRFQMKIKVKKSDFNRANIFFQKKIKAEESVTFQNSFSSMADFPDVASVLPAARLIKESRIFVAVQEANRPWETNESYLAFWLSS